MKLLKFSDRKRKVKYRNTTVLSEKFPLVNKLLKSLNIWQSKKLAKPSKLNIKWYRIKKKKKNLTYLQAISESQNKKDKPENMPQYIIIKINIFTELMYKSVQY